MKRGMRPELSLSAPSALSQLLKQSQSEHSIASVDQSDVRKLGRKGRRAREDIWAVN